MNMDFSPFFVFYLCVLSSYIKEESMRGIHTGRLTERRKNFISLSSFPPIIAFLDTFIVSSETDGAARVTISANRKPTHFLFFCAYDRQV